MTDTAQIPSHPRNARVIVATDSRPYLARHVMLRHDPARDRWVMLVPERVMVPEPTAIAVLQLADGKRTVQDIADELARIYNAPADVIAADAVEMFQDLADRGFLKLKPTEGQG